ncbi:MAG: dihydrodipicolinate synthase family protein [Candidatus Diapherotrites archaeon]|nr:dihydrodipicolinate synthase family protein [Candidatus Diapherotrites archaeon]
MTAKNISGCYPALVTPIKDTGNAIDNPVNQEAMNMLIDHVIKGGVDGILIAGCTGHSCTLTWEEQTSLIKNSLEHVSGKVSVITRDGSNCTREAIDAAKKN